MPILCHVECYFGVRSFGGRESQKSSGGRAGEEGRGDVVEKLSTKHTLRDAMVPFGKHNRQNLECPSVVAARLHESFGVPALMSLPARETS